MVLEWPQTQICLCICLIDARIKGVLVQTCLGCQSHFISLFCLLEWSSLKPSSLTRTRAHLLPRHSFVISLRTRLVLCKWPPSCYIANTDPWILEYQAHSTMSSSGSAEEISGREHLNKSRSCSLAHNSNSNRRKAEAEGLLRVEISSQLATEWSDISKTNPKLTS